MSPTIFFCWLLVLQSALISAEKEKDDSLIKLLAQMYEKYKEYGNNLRDRHSSSNREMAYSYSSKPGRSSYTYYPTNKLSSSYKSAYKSYKIKPASYSSYEAPSSKYSTIIQGYNPSSDASVDYSVYPYENNHKYYSSIGDINPSNYESSPITYEVDSPACQLQSPAAAVDYAPSYDYTAGDEYNPSTEYRSKTYQIVDPSMIGNINPEDIIGTYYKKRKTKKQYTFNTHYTYGQ